jgi:hypothetical protein
MLSLILAGCGREDLPTAVASPCSSCDLPPSVEGRLDQYAVSIERRNLSYYLVPQCEDFVSVGAEGRCLPWLDSSWWSPETAHLSCWPGDVSLNFRLLGGENILNADGTMVGVRMTVEYEVGFIGAGDPGSSGHAVFEVFADGPGDLCIGRVEFID